MILRITTKYELGENIGFDEVTENDVISEGDVEKLFYTQERKHKKASVILMKQVKGE